MAKFSRSSTAYKQDGSVVNAGVPRIEANGVMVEEGTTNLITDITTLTLFDSSGLLSLSSFAEKHGANNIVKVIKQAGTLSSNSSLRKYITSLATATIYTLSFKAKVLSGSINDIGGHWTGSNVAYMTKILLDDGWYKIYYALTLVNPLTASNTGVGFYGTGYGEYLITEIQLEQKAYATNWQIGGTTRTAESLTVPATALNASEGTIEFDVYKLTTAKNNNNTVFSLGVYSAGNRFDCWFDCNNVYALGIYDGDNWFGWNNGSNFPLNTKIRVVVKWGSFGVSLFVNGAKVATKTKQLTSNQIGNVLRLGGFDGGPNYQSNALFSNLRISSIARSDAELSNTGALSVDEWTTYFAPFTSNIGATCHPTMLVQGQGQVLLSRVGRGTRSIKVQGSGQVKLKRSACYYPTIAVGTKGEVQLSRQGIGYRGMKVEGQGSFKIQEPNIEIYPEIREREATTNIIERESTTEVIGVPYTGDTIKIKGTFKSFEGVLADPTGITLKIYDTINNLLTTINVTATNKISAGIYEVNYTVPEGYQALYYEWHCVQGDSPQVTMGKITVLKRGQA